MQARWRNYAITQALPRIAEMTLPEGLLVESLLSRQSRRLTNQPKQRVRNLLARRSGKVSEPQAIEAPFSRSTTFSSSTDCVRHRSNTGRSRRGHRGEFGAAEVQRHRLGLVQIIRQLTNLVGKPAAVSGRVVDGVDYLLNTETDVA